MGYVIQFGDWTFIIAVTRYGLMKWLNILKPFNIDVALLPINGNDPARGVAGNLDVREAAALAKQSMQNVVIPCHYDMFTFNTADPNDFATEAEKISQPYQF